MLCKFTRLNSWLTITLLLVLDFMPLLVIDLLIMHFTSQVVVTAFYALHFTPIITVLHVSVGLPSPLLTASRIQALVLVHAFEMSNYLSLCSVFPCLLYIYTTALLKTLIWLFRRSWLIFCDNCCNTSLAVNSYHSFILMCMLILLRVTANTQGLVWGSKARNLGGSIKQFLKRMLLFNKEKGFCLCFAISWSQISTKIHKFPNRHVIWKRSSWFACHVTFVN